MSEIVIDRLEISVCAIPSNDPDRMACADSVCDRPAENEIKLTYRFHGSPYFGCTVKHYCDTHFDFALRNAATIFASDVHQRRHNRAERAS